MPAVVAETIRPQGVLELEPLVVSVRDHDDDAFTQGLEIVEGRMFESTGAPNSIPNSTTSIREVDPITGDVLRIADFGNTYFGEGLAVVGDELFQLSWLSGVTTVFDKETFEITRQFTYETQGWGLCFDGTELVMTDGSGLLYFRDPTTFEVNRTVEVRRNGNGVSALNELECVDGTVWSNVFLSTEIFQIDPTTGNVLAVVDGSELAAPFLEQSASFVLNGIAYDEGSGNFVITGKNWDEMYEVQFVPAPG